MKYLTQIEQLKYLDEYEKDRLIPVTEKFDFRCNEYYLSLIDWNDPDDPIRRIIIPDIRELDEWGRLDPSNEETYSVMPGLEHKYNSTVLLLVSNVCEGICRYCFRKRLFIDYQDDFLRDQQEALEYIRQHREITNVLLTGGDPLALSPAKLEDIIRELTVIEHVRIIRIGTRVPAFNPYRIIDEPALPEMIGKYSSDRKKIYIMAHFVHPRELTAPAIRAVNILQRAGAIVANQMPLKTSQTDAGVLISLPGKAPDPIDTVIALEVKAPLVMLSEGKEMGLK